MVKSGKLEKRVLILAPLEQDAAATVQILTEVGLFCMICDSMAGLLDQAALGAGTILLAGEVLTPETGQTLAAAWQRQPAWSDLPLIVLVKSREQTRRQAALIQRLSSETNVTLLEHPIPVATLVTVVRSGLRARQRQYEVRDLTVRFQDQHELLKHEIVEREQAQTDLERLNQTLEQHVDERTTKLWANNNALEAKIRELRRAEAEIDQERQFLRTLIDHMPDYIYVKDTDSRFLLGNTQVIRVMGAQSEADILGKNDFEFYPADLAGRYYTDDQLILQTGRPLLDHEEPLIDPAGHQHWLSTTKVPLRDSKGQIMGLVGIGRDITDRKRMAQALRDSEERFRKIFEEGPLGMFIVNQTLHITQVNTKLCEMFEYTKAELIGQPPFSLFHPDEVDENRAALDRLFHGSISGYQTEQRCLTKTHNLMWVSLTASVIRADDIVYGLSILTDITERKQIEAERLALLKVLNQQHEQLRLLSARLAEVQERERQHIAQELHDQVGQNLTALNFNLGFVQSQLPADAAAVQIIHPQLTEAIALVAQTTDWVRDIMTELRPALLDESGLVDALEWYADRVAGWTGLVVTVQGRPPSPRLAAPIENTLFRIVQEALTNVVRHAAASRVTISIQVDSQQVYLIVTDNGMGFSKRTSSNGMKEGHWGLLTMTERAEMVNGHCRVHSRPGHGTQVMIEVPRTAPASIGFGQEAP